MNAVDINSGDDLRDLYRELILDHARKPRHFGKLANATHTAEGINPLCGDKLHLYMHVTDGIIDDVGFEGSGCAISVASASLLTDMIAGHSVSDALAYADAVKERMTGTQADAQTSIDLGKLAALDGVREFPSRIKCATLAWHALDAALTQKSSPATTE